jgi:hypothetical protein
MYPSKTTSQWFNTKLGNQLTTIPSTDPLARFTDRTQIFYIGIFGDSSSTFVIRVSLVFFLFSKHKKKASTRAEAPKSRRHRTQIPVNNTLRSSAQHLLSGLDFQPEDSTKTIRARVLARVQKLKSDPSALEGFLEHLTSIRRERSRRADDVNGRQKNVVKANILAAPQFSAEEMAKTRQVWVEEERRKAESARAATAKRVEEMMEQQGAVVEKQEAEFERVSFSVFVGSLGLFLWFLGGFELFQHKPLTVRTCRVFGANFCPSK